MDPHVLHEPQRIFEFRMSRDVWMLDQTQISYEVSLMMESGVACTDWKPIPCEQHLDPSPDEVLSDTVILWPFVPVFSARAVDALRHHFAYGQLLPIDVSGHPFFIYKSLVGCRAASASSNGKSPFIMSLFWTDVLQTEVGEREGLPPLADCTTFNVVKPERLQLFVRSSFVDDVKAAGLRGIEFVEVVDFDYV